MTLRIAAVLLTAALWPILAPSFDPLPTGEKKQTNPCVCSGYDGPGGPCYAGPGGPMYAGPGGPAYDGYLQHLACRVCGCTVLQAHAMRRQPRPVTPPVQLQTPKWTGHSSNYGP
jgi:hypothetical protein